MTKVVIVGITDQAEMAYYYLSRERDYHIAAFSIDRAFMKSLQITDLPLVAFEEIEKTYPPDEYRMFIAIGYSQVNKLRAEKYHQAKDKGYQLISYISPRATIADNVLIGDNCFIFEDNTIQPFAKIGNNVTLWSGNHIGHHSIIEDHCFIASHVVISGRVRVEPYCFIGVNSTIRDHITISKECVIGAGSLIMKDTMEKEVYAPARTEAIRLKSDQFRNL